MKFGMAITAARSALIVDSVLEQGAGIKAYLDELGFDVDTTTEHARAFEFLANN